MALTGGTAYDHYHRITVRWRPAGPIVDEYNFATSTSGYRCLGVIGDPNHWPFQAGDHTPRSTHTTIATPGGPTIWPKNGWVYAGDFRVVDPDRFERWLLRELRAGRWAETVKYFNINNRHWNRKAIKAGKMFAYASNSGDDHFHLSTMPGREHSRGGILAAWHRHRNTPELRAQPAATPSPAPRHRWIVD